MLYIRIYIRLSESLFTLECAPAPMTRILLRRESTRYIAEGSHGSFDQL